MKVEPTLGVKAFIMSPVIRLRRFSNGDVHMADPPLS
jgi:hypothetical protein